jgi:hypothetical protein
MHAYWLILDEHGNHRERTDLSDEFAGVSEQAALAKAEAGRRADHPATGDAYC